MSVSVTFLYVLVTWNDFHDFVTNFVASKPSTSGYGIRCGYTKSHELLQSPLVRDEFYTLVRITLERMTL